ncbi:MAG: hypothetical protein R2695_03960 [Acidimicrobiales bacterium]
MLDLDRRTSGDNPDDPYGRFWLDGRMVYAHRFAYEELVGPIPADTTSTTCA